MHLFSLEIGAEWGGTQRLILSGLSSHWRVFTKVFSRELIATVDSGRGCQGFEAAHSMAVGNNCHAQS
jgi:hypothetical protein